MSTLISAIKREDLDTLRALNASFRGDFFSEDGEQAIEPIIHTQVLLGEWKRREDVRTIDDFWKIAKAGERARFVWMHDGIRLALTTCGMVAEQEGFVRAGTSDLTVTTQRLEYRLPSTGRLVFRMHDLRIPQELLDYLEQVA